jgi:hypothetical protein
VDVEASETIICREDIHAHELAKSIDVKEEGEKMETQSKGWGVTG